MTDHSERLGDAFEYLLAVLGSQGDAGQFRTPRHIIDFIVNRPRPQERRNPISTRPAAPPASSSSYKHIQRLNTDPQGRNADHRTKKSRLAPKTFKATTSRPTWSRLSGWCRFPCTALPTAQPCARSRLGAVGADPVETAYAPRELIADSTAFYVCPRAASARTTVLRLQSRSRAKRGCVVYLAGYLTPFNSSLSSIVPDGGHVPEL